MNLVTNTTQRLSALVLRLVRRVKPWRPDMMPMGIENGDWVTHPGWIHGPVKVINQNWALRAVAIQLGPKGGIVVWPMDKDMKHAPAPNEKGQK